MKKSKIIFLLASSLIFSNNTYIFRSLPLVYASEQTQNNKISHNSTTFSIERDLNKFLEGAKKQAREEHKQDIFVYRLGLSDGQLHNHSSIDIQTINDPKELFKSENPNIEQQDYVFVKINDKFITKNNRIVIMNPYDEIVASKEDYQKVLDKRLDNMDNFEYNNASIHSLIEIKDDKKFLTALDASGVWMGNGIKKYTFEDIPIYTQDLRIENKLTCHFGITDTQKEPGYNHNLTFDHFAENDGNLKDMIEKAGIKDEDDDRDKIIKFALKMGEIHYNFDALFDHYTEKYNNASDLFAVTKRQTAMCMGFSTSAARAFNLLGIPSYAAIARVSNGGGHVVTRAFYDGKWNTVDLTSSRSKADEYGFSEAMFNKTENSYKVIETDFSPKEALSAGEGNSIVFINTEYEKWAQYQPMEKLVLVNTEAIYEFAKGTIATQRDTEEAVKERLEKRAQKAKEDKERFEREEKERKRIWDEEEAKKKANEIKMREEMQRKQREYEEREEREKQEKLKKEQALKEESKKAQDSTQSESEQTQDEQSKAQQALKENPSKQASDKQSNKTQEQATDTQDNKNQDIEKQTKKDDSANKQEINQEIEQEKNNTDALSKDDKTEKTNSKENNNLEQEVPKQEIEEQEVKQQENTSKENQQAEIITEEDSSSKIESLDKKEEKKDLEKSNLESKKDTQEIKEQVQNTENLNEKESKNIEKKVLENPTLKLDNNKANTSSLSSLKFSTSQRGGSGGGGGSRGGSGGGGGTRGGSGGGGGIKAANTKNTQAQTLSANLTQGTWEQSKTSWKFKAANGSYITNN